MSKFSLDKRGYNTKEVDDFISSLYLKYEEKLSEQKDRVFALKNELDNTQARLQQYIEKDQEISKALIYAVEKADQIESSSKKLYDLEIKRVRLLYQRWEEMLLQIESNYPKAGNSNAHVYELIDNFKTAIEDVLEQNYNLNNSTANSGIIKEGLRKKNDNYVRNILNKMNYAFNDKPEIENKEVAKPKQIRKINLGEVVQTHDRENNRLNLLGNKLNEIAKQVDLNKGEVLADKYLNSEIEDDIANSAYAKNITRKNITKEDDSPFNYAYPTPNESGFDLKEALNPKQELDEIMADFDFFETDN